MRYILILTLGMLWSLAASGGEFAILDASGGLWSVQQLFARMLAEGRSAAAGKTDIAFESVEKLPEKLRKGQAAVIAGKPDKRLKTDYRYVPLKPVSVVVAAGNDCPIDDISVEDLRRIYSGRAAVWSRFGGNDIPVRRAGYGMESAAGKVFNCIVMADSTGQNSRDPGRMIAPGMAICSTRSAAAALVQAVPGMIAFGDHELAVDPQGKYKVLKVNGIYPDDKAVSEAVYPLSVPLGILFHKDVAEDQIRKIICFIKKNSCAKRVQKARR